jgi:hypothetical protein
VSENGIQERDDIYIELLSEAADEKQGSSQILPDRRQCGTGKAKSKWSQNGAWAKFKDMAPACDTVGTRNSLASAQGTGMTRVLESSSAGSSRAQQKPQQTVKKVRLERTRRVYYYLLGSTEFSAKSQRPRNEGALGFRTRFERERDQKAGVRSDQCVWG